MKTAYLLGSLNRGGTETLLLDVFKNAAKADFEFIGIHRKDGVLKNDFYAAKPKIYQLAPKSPFDIFYFFKLRKILKREQTDIVHAQQFIDAFFAKIAVFGTKIKVVQTYHGFEKDNFLLKFIIKKTDKNFFVSDYQREFYIKKYNLNPQKQVTVYNGVSFEKLDLPYPAPDFLQQENKKSLRISMVGNFVSVRSQNSLCPFLKLLKEQKNTEQKLINFNFYFVGSRVEKQAYLFDDCVEYCRKNNLSECVHFVGSRNDVPAILQNIDAFVYSSSHDTFGIAVIEAIAAGIPVFVNDWAVMQEITENGKFATLYKTKDENDLLQKFLLFLQNKNEYAENAKKSAAAVRNRFSIENHIKNLNGQYQLLNKC